MNKQMRSIEQINSSGIAAEMREQGIEELEFLGSFLPVEMPLNTSEGDARIYIFVFPNGYKVAATNGDPVWEAQDQQAWDALMDEFETGI